VGGWKLLGAAYDVAAGRGDGAGLKLAAADGLNGEDWVVLGVEAAPKAEGGLAAVLGINKADTPVGVGDDDENGDEGEDEPVGVGGTVAIR